MCVTSPCFLRWFMSNAPVFGHCVLVFEDEKVARRGEERSEKGGVGKKKKKEMKADKRGRDD